MLKVEGDSKIYQLVNNPDDPLRPIARWITREEILDVVVGPNWATSVIEIPLEMTRALVWGESILYSYDLDINSGLLLQF